MVSKFRRGMIAYTSNGRRYTVDDVDDGMVYCSTEGGAETEFAEKNLLTEAEWQVRSGNKAGLVYARLKQARLYTAAPPRIDQGAADRVLAKADRLMPGLLDYAAFATATRILAEAGDGALVAGLSIVKCRDVFEAAKPEIRLNLLASLLGTPPQLLAGADGLGDNLMRAMLEKGMAGQATAFESFCDRRRD